MKNPSTISSARLRKLIKFTKTIDQTKKIERVIYLNYGNRKENDAEHSWHLAMFLLLFEKEYRGYDFCKVMKLALTHDLCEIYAGDTFFFSPTRNDGKKERELKGAKKLFKDLPKDLAKEYLDLFLEYEEGKTKEAKIVNAFDKLQPMMQNILCHGRTWKEKGVTLRMVDKLKREHVKDPISLKIYNLLIKEIKENNIAAKEQR